MRLALSVEDRLFSKPVKFLVPPRLQQTILRSTRAWMRFVNSNGAVCASRTCPSLSASKSTKLFFRRLARFRYALSVSVIDGSHTSIQGALELKSRRRCAVGVRASVSPPPLRNLKSRSRPRRLPGPARRRRVLPRRR